MAGSTGDPMVLVTSNIHVYVSFHRRAAPMEIQGLFDSCPWQLVLHRSYRSARRVDVASALSHFATISHALCSHQFGQTWQAHFWNWCLGRLRLNQPILLHNSLNCFPDRTEPQAESLVKHRFDFLTIFSRIASNLPIPLVNQNGCLEKSLPMFR